MISAIVLAAGKSTRMGRQKLLLPIGEGTVISQIVDEVLASPVAEVFVVVRGDREAIEQALEGRTVRFVENPHKDGDMLSSVRCGLKAMGQPDGVLVVLGDQPQISRHVVTALIRAFGDDGDRIVVPVHQGKRGHPLLFSAVYHQEILESYDGVGLRGLMKAHADSVCEVEVDSPAVLENMNVPADYERVRQRRNKRGS